MTATTDPLFRDATVEDALAMLEVIGAAFARWPPVDVGVPPIEHLRWKMSPPGDIPLHHVIVFVEGRPAAAQLRWVCRLQVGANDYIGDTPADLAVHPAFQGQGFSRLIKERDHARLVAGKAPGFDMLSNAPQVRHMNEPDLITRQMTTWFHPFRLRSYASAHYRHGGLPGLAGAVRRRLARRAATPRDPVRIEVLERFDERTDDLWEAARRSFDVLTFRDADYLNWRFARPLAGPVTILGLTEGARVHAYAVVRRRVRAPSAPGRGDGASPRQRSARRQLLAPGRASRGARPARGGLRPGRDANDPLGQPGASGESSRGARYLRGPIANDAPDDERLRLRVA